MRREAVAGFAAMAGAFLAEVLTFGIVASWGD
jgi:hypothetical protein